MSGHGEKAPPVLRNSAIFPHVQRSRFPNDSMWLSEWAMHTLYERGSVLPFHSRSVVTGSTLQAGTAPGELPRYACPGPGGSHDSGRVLAPGRAVLRPSQPCTDRCPRRLHRQVEWPMPRVRRQARDWTEARAARPETEATDGLVARRLGSSQRLPGDDGHGV